MPGRPGTTAPTTAQVIRRTDAAISRATYAGLGVALHHFTDLLGTTIDPLDLHRATTTLTKQVCRVLDDDDDLDAIRRLVTDADRVALPDGRRAAALCGTTWDRVRETALQRATASCEGAREFGHDAIVNLAAVRGVGAVRPWWGTPIWRRRVDLVPAGAISPDERELLLDEPELAADELLSIALNGAEGSRPFRPAGPSGHLVDPPPIDTDGGASTHRAGPALAS